jgi:hypothetical protein
MSFGRMGRAFSRLGLIVHVLTSAPPPTPAFLLQRDGSSKLLLRDGSSFLLLGYS